MAMLVSAQDRPTFRADVSQVHVDVEILGKDGRVVAGLSKGDFRVFDEGREQPIVGFSADEQPLDVVLLFDISGSMRSKATKVASAAGKALQELRPGDRVAVMTFNTSTRLIAPFSEDLASIECDVQNIARSHFRGGTYIHQAADDAAGYFLQGARTQRRRAVLIITDNLGVRTRPEMSVVRHLWEADALLSGLVVRHSGYQVGRIISAPFAPFVKVGGMEHIAEKTGGDTIADDDLDSAFPKMMHRIRTRYSLYYPMPECESDSVRSIRVELKNETRNRFPEAHVYARRGYWLTRR